MISGLILQQQIDQSTILQEACGLMKHLNNLNPPKKTNSLFGIINFVKKKLNKFLYHARIQFKMKILLNFFITKEKSIVKEIN